MLLNALLNFKSKDNILNYLKLINSLDSFLKTSIIWEFCGFKQLHVESNHKFKINPKVTLFS